MWLFYGRDTRQTCKHVDYGHWSTVATLVSLTTADKCCQVCNDFCLSSVVATTFLSCVLQQFKNVYKAQLKKNSF